MKIHKIEFLRERVFITGMVFILPFVYIKTTIDPVLSLRFFILSILLLGISFLEIFIFIRKGNSPVIQKRIIWIPLLCYLFFSVLSLTNASNPYVGIPEILKILMFMIVLFVSDKQSMMIVVLGGIVSYDQQQHFGFGAGWTDSAE